MIDISPNYVIDKENKPKAVLLNFSDWQKVISALEELDDIKAYDQAKAMPQESIPFDQAIREIQAEYDS